MRRQEILHDPLREFRFVVTRRALVWNPDLESVSMGAQLDRVRELAALPNVTVAVLADDARPIGGWSSFTIYVGGMHPFVAIELEHRSLPMHDEADVDVYRRRFAELLGAASELPGPPW